MKTSRTVLFSLFALAPICARAEGKVSVTVNNALNTARPAETIVVPWREISSHLPDTQPDHVRVRDAKGNVIPSQFTNFHPDARPAMYDDFLFQHDFTANEHSATFTIEKSADPVPPFPSKVFARYVPERLDDFAWENDRIAHRIYGPGLDTPEAGKSRMVSSAIDVWAKRVPYLIVDRWYLRGHDAYHKDNGEGLDFYSAGSARGCGGTGVWDGKKLYTAHNWKTWKVIANGPIRAVFELGYEPWDAGGVKVSELKRFTVDAGRNLHQMDSTFTFQKSGDITVAVGVSKKHKDAASGDVTQNEANGWLSVWETYEKAGQLGCAAVMNPGTLSGFAEDEMDKLALTKAKSGEPVRYYIGAGWDRSGQFKSKEDWNAYLAAFAEKLKSPIKISKVEAQ